MSTGLVTNIQNCELYITYRPRKTVKDFHLVIVCRFLPSKSTVEITDQKRIQNNCSVWRSTKSILSSKMEHRTEESDARRFHQLKEKDSLIYKDCGSIGTVSIRFRGSITKTFRKFTEIYLTDVGVIKHELYEDDLIA